jgi:glutamate 5-kinase
MATAVGENVIIANGTVPNVLDRILAGEEIGTLFLAEGKTVPAWKRWIGYTVRPRGRLYLDDGACRAIAEKGKSLLAIGISQVEGDFSKGELVSIVDSAGSEIARGLTNYTAHDLLQIKGKRTEEIAGILGSLQYAEVVHRDNLVLLAAMM